jgi:peroxiredoxin Q/BCP
VAPLSAKAKPLSDDGVRLAVELCPFVLSAAVAGRDVRERCYAAGDRSRFRIDGPFSVHAAMVFGYGADHVGGETLRGGSVGDVADIDGDDLPARLLDSFDDLALHVQGTHEPIEVSADDDLRATCLHELDSAPQTVAALEGVPPETSSSRMMSTTRKPSRLQWSRMRFSWSSGLNSPLRPPTWETLTIPTARGLEALLPVVEGQPAPDFTLTSDSGETVTLSSLQGRPVILYFYPEDDTPGCTAQACEIRDEWSRFRERGAVVLGVSPDDEASYARFRDKFSLPFTLLADPDHAVADEYGVWVEKKNYGRTYMGIERSTFVIDPEGNVAKALRRVKPEGHADKVLEALPG